MPKKVSYQYNTNQYGGGGGGAAASRIEQNTHSAGNRSRDLRYHREHRIIPGSVFSNDSSNLSTGGGGGGARDGQSPNPVLMTAALITTQGGVSHAKKSTSEFSNVSRKISSSENVSVNNENEQAVAGDHVKHIHFAITNDSIDNSNEQAQMSSQGSSRVSEENLSRSGGADFVISSGMVTSASFQNGDLDKRRGSITHISQKGAINRNSFKGGRRSSFKFKAAHRGILLVCVLEERVYELKYCNTQFII